MGRQSTTAGTEAAASPSSASDRSTPARPARASRCTTALVEPPTAPSTTPALRKPALVRIRSGVNPSAAISTILRPERVPTRRRSPLGAGAVADPGTARPSTSAMMASVDAVPMTMHVPPVGASTRVAASISASLTSPALRPAHMRRQSVHAPTRSPRQCEAIIGPATTSRTGLPAEMAPINWPGTVLSQPPSRTTPSMGWARTSSSTSRASRLRNIMLVGSRNTSPRDMVGKTMGTAPASTTPRLTASRRAAISRWHGVKSLIEWPTPMIGRLVSASSKPAAARNTERTKRLKPGSP